MASFIVTEKAMRPASPARQCFYCQQPVGTEHKPDCVLVMKRVAVRMTVQYEIQVPAYWGREEIEFHRNDGSWCANNALDELQELIDREAGACICGGTRFDYIGGDSEPFLAEE